MLCLVERVTGGRIGANPRVPLVVSRRSTQEKKPWNRLAGIEQAIEAEFVRPALPGESILPFRVFRTFEGVIPVDDKGAMLDAAAADRRGKTGLAGWMTAAEKQWNEHSRRSVTRHGAAMTAAEKRRNEPNASKMTLIGRWNYHNELGAQFPIGTIRIVYAKAGTLPAAAIIEDPRSVIDHMLYWMPVQERREGLYLASILGSEAARAKVAALQARGQWGARHFDKVMFTLPIPRFDPKNNLHKSLVEIGGEAEIIAAEVELPDGMHFQTARRRVRDALAESGVSHNIRSMNWS